MDKLLEIQLTKLNLVMEKQDIFAEVVLIGGFAGKYLLGNYRKTLDIDFLVSAVKDAAGSRNFAELLEAFGMEAVTVAEVPPVEEIEVHDRLDFGNLSVIVPTIEYFAITKIFSDRIKDEEDLVQQGILKACDPKKLAEMMEYYRKDLLNPDNQNLNFHTLRDYFESHGIVK